MRALQGSGTGVGQTCVRIQIFTNYGLHVSVSPFESGSQTSDLLGFSCQLKETMHLKLSRYQLHDKELTLWAALLLLSPCLVVCKPPLVRVRSLGMLTCLIHGFSPGPPCAPMCFTLYNSRTDCGRDSTTRPWNCAPLSSGCLGRLHFPGCFAGGAMPRRSGQQNVSLFQTGLYTLA